MNGAARSTPRTPGKSVNQLVMKLSVWYCAWNAPILFAHAKPGFGERHEPMPSWR